MATKTLKLTRKDLERQRQFLLGAIRFADRNSEDHPLLDEKLLIVEDELEKMDEDDGD